MKLNNANSASAVAEPGISPVSRGEMGGRGPVGQKGGPESHGLKASGKSLLGYFIAFFSSLRLTVVLLGIGIVLIFVGTIAQVDLGLYQAQNEFFRSFLVYW